ncbi:MAG: hypothetical protein ACXWW4_02440, partial [Candidatus Binatia bacterium]
MYKHWTELIKPKQLEVEERTLTATFGRFTAEPFERGFGQTIGNSVRRILLSSLMGASIVAVRIKGVLHEFSTVAGVTEDVAEIILNLKEVRLRLNEGDTTITYSASTQTGGAPRKVTPAEWAVAVRPSRYWPSDQLEGFATTEFDRH